MIKKLSKVTVFVKDQEKAVAWYTKVLGFQIKQDSHGGEGSRFVTVAPKGQEEIEIVLLSPEKNCSSPQDGISARVGKVSHWVFDTDNCRAAYQNLKDRGAKFTAVPTQEPWGGTMAMFEDPDGNSFVLVQNH